MKIKNIFKIILFILVSAILLISLSGCTKLNTKTSSDLEVDTKFDETLSSINTILERNEQYEKVDNILKNLEFYSCSYTQRVFCSENNDKKIINNRDNRVSRVEKIINLHKINFLTANFNLL